MFDYISTYHYGRCVKSRNDWDIQSVCVNRIHYIHNGEVTVLLDGVPYHLKPGIIYLFPQNKKFELLLSESTKVDHTFFDFFTLPAISMQAPIAINPCNSAFIASATRILFEIAEQYQTYPSMQRNAYTKLVESYLLNLLFLIDKESGINTINDSRINIALEYIHKNYNQEITLSQLTEITNLEKNYLIRLFKQYMNCTPFQYITKYRFNIALSLIKRDYSFGEVALQVGYSDIASFSHAFKRIYGISPSEIKREYTHNTLISSK